MSDINSKEKEEKNELTYSERFMNNVVLNFAAEVGKKELSDYENMLLQHLYIKIDYTMEEWKKAKWSEKEKKYIEKYQDLNWNNLNMSKLALDSIERVKLGLDALVENHIHVIFTKNKKQKYNVDLRIGYEGKLYYKKKMSIIPIDDIIIETVYKTDYFKPIKKDIKNLKDFYEFEIKNPFLRGDVIGGFGYIQYKEMDRNINNKLILVTLEDIKRSQNKAQTKTIWNSFNNDMCYKSIVHKVCKFIRIDPKQVTKEYFSVENSDYNNEDHGIGDLVEINENDNVVSEEQNIVYENDNNTMPDKNISEDQEGGFPSW